jgi:hypothetical protein
MRKIRKYKNWEEIPKNDLEEFNKKNYAERLDELLILNNLARNFYNSNPLNKPLNNGRRISKFRSIAERI